MARQTTQIKPDFHHPQWFAAWAKLTLGQRLRITRFCTEADADLAAIIVKSMFLPTNIWKDEVTAG